MMRAVLFTLALTVYASAFGQANPTNSTATASDLAKPRISTAEAAKHHQETVVVTGKVAQVSIREKLVYLNLDKKFPETPLACVIFDRATNQFGDLKQLEGKQVEVSGRIEEYRNRLQIILNRTNQLKVVENP